MTIVTQIAALRRRNRISGTRVASLAGTSASNIYAIENGRRDPSASTLERIAGAAGIRLLAFPSEGASFVSDTAEVLRHRVDVGDNRGAYRQLIQISDDLVRTSPWTASLLSYPAPPTVALGWEAAIAGIVEWRLGEKGLPAPDWTRTYGRELRDRWEPFPSPYEPQPAEVPEALRRRNVWIERAELESA